MYQNNFLHNSVLQNIHILTSNRASSIDSIINNLQIDDVKLDTNFNATLERIKKQVLIDPIVISDPKITNNQSVTRDLTIEQQINGMRKNIHIITVSFPYTGSTELLKYVPSSYSFSMNDAGILQPSYNNTLDVKVEVADLDPDIAIAEARRLLAPTFRLVESNNAVANTWNPMLTDKINADIKAHREKLTKLYS